MKKLSANQVRNMWIDFFKSKKHHFLEPVSLIPVEDPSLLWINSGVATLKPYFDGRKIPPAPRLTNSQKSIRTNDIENVGVTARHQTMFEMLGNFSIGDYFKKEAIHFAWELLTSSEWFDIDKSKLYITVFEDDDEAYNIWTNEIKIPEERIFKGTRDTNFWDVGAGPCGPNTEIFYDRGEKWDPEKIGPRLLKDDIENDRYIEIWNIVFSEFNNNGQNDYTELPRKNIDTGAGLERLVSLFQEAPTNFETDLFLPTILHIEKLVNDPNLKYNFGDYTKFNLEELKLNTCYKVIADHVRAATFAIADGVYPGNKERGYIIRRLIRRSSVYGRKLGIKGSFIHILVDDVIFAMGEFYSYLNDKKDQIALAIKNEEEKFLKTLSKGSDYLEQIISKFNLVSGKDALLLFESYGFPIELTLEMANEKNVKVEIDDFNSLLEDVKNISRNSRKENVAWNKQSEIMTTLKIDSEFIGYESEESDSIINFMFWNDEELSETNGSDAIIILNKTPFYAEKGGQASDIGSIYVDNEVVRVIDVQQGPNNQNLHHVNLNGTTLRLGQEVHAEIDHDKRNYTMKNHSGTHILHAAIREVLGPNAMQAGSFNNENGLRIDISYNDSISQEQITKIQEICNREIKNTLVREVYNVSMTEAVEKYNALAFFTEKYNEIVRVVKFGSFSSELCGGTHVENTSEIEELMITGFESKGSGVYRFSAITSHKTLSEYLNNEFNKLKNEVHDLMSKYNEHKTDFQSKEIENKYNDIFSLNQSKSNLNKLKKMISEYKDIFKSHTKKVKDKLTELNVKKYYDIEPVEDLIKIYVDLNIEEMKTLTDFFKNKYNKVKIILLNKINKVAVFAISNDLANDFSAIDMLNNFDEFTIKGGGSKTFAQGKIL